jgi:hypothetical protein
MFGFQHTMNGISRTEQEASLHRTRLYSRLLQIRGPANLKVIYPTLQKQLETVLLQQLEKGKLNADGMSRTHTQKKERVYVNSSRFTVHPSRAHHSNHVFSTHGSAVLWRKCRLVTHSLEREHQTDRTKPPMRPLQSLY